MYHPSRGGVRGGRDQFKWDDVKVDKHRENYIGHSIMAPVGRWQKGKDLHWYNKDKKSASQEAEMVKEEIRRIKEEEEQAMREALGLAPKRSGRSQGTRLDKHEYADLVKRGSTAEDLGAGHAEAAQVQGVGLYRMPHDRAASGSQPSQVKSEERATLPNSEQVPVDGKMGTERRQHEGERKDEKERKHKKKRSHDTDDKRKHHKKRRHDSDSD